MIDLTDLAYGLAHTLLMLMSCGESLASRLLPFLSRLGARVVDGWVRGTLPTTPRRRGVLLMTLDLFYRVLQGLCRLPLPAR